MANEISMSLLTRVGLIGIAGVIAQSMETSTQTIPKVVPTPYFSRSLPRPEPVREERPPIYAIEPEDPMEDVEGKIGIGSARNRYRKPNSSTNGKHDNVLGFREFYSFRSLGL